MMLMKAKCKGKGWRKWVIMDKECVALSNGSHMQFISKEIILLKDSLVMVTELSLRCKNCENCMFY